MNPSSFHLVHSEFDSTKGCVSLPIDESIQTLLKTWLRDRTQSTPIELSTFLEHAYRNRYWVTCDCKAVSPAVMYIRKMVSGYTLCLHPDYSDHHPGCSLNRKRISDPAIMLMECIEASSINYCSPQHTTLIDQYQALDKTFKDNHSLSRTYVDGYTTYPFQVNKTAQELSKLSLPQSCAVLVIDDYSETSVMLNHKGTSLEFPYEGRHTKLGNPQDYSGPYLALLEYGYSKLRKNYVVFQEIASTPVISKSNLLPAVSGKGRKILKHLFTDEYLSECVIGIPDVSTPIISINKPTSSSFTKPDAEITLLSETEYTQYALNNSGAADQFYIRHEIADTQQLYKIKHLLKTYLQKGHTYEENTIAV